LRIAKYRHSAVRNRSGSSRPKRGSGGPGDRGAQLSDNILPSISTRLRRIAATWLTKEKSGSQSTAADEHLLDRLAG
jgi:hypothetical protein